MKYTLKLLKEFKRSRLSLVEEHSHIVIMEATNAYIPIAEFKEMFNYILKIQGVKHDFTAMIFDKRSLSVFHQPSMEWYFVDWKERVYDKGISKHRKILPNDKAFVQSVNLGRQSILKKYPNGKYTEMDIAYSSSMEGAIEELI